MRRFAVAVAVFVALVGMAGADSWVELTEVADGEYVENGGCMVGGHGCVFVAVGGGSDSGNFYRWVPDTEQDGEQARPLNRVETVPSASCIWTATCVRILYSMASAGSARITVYGSGGSVVAALPSGPQQPGRHETDWNLTDGHGRHVAAGVYLVRIDTPEGTFRAKAVVGQ